MKKYLIFTYNITGMGGGQQYICNKYDYLRRTGNDVMIYSAISGQIIIDKLKPFADHILPELKYAPHALRASCVEKTVAAIVAETMSEPCEKILVESSGAYETQWAELVAQRLECRHICMSLAEQQNKWYSQGNLEFFYFKYLRKELYGIHRNSLNLLFRGYHEIPDSEQYAFSATCTNVVDEHDTAIPAVDADISIGGIWRTNKEGFVETIQNLVPYIRQHPNQNFRILIIGSGSKANEKQAQQILAPLSNAHLQITGYLYPIPLGLLRSCDVFVSTAGSSRIPMFYGIPSICVTTGEERGKRRFYPLGILYYTTKNAVVPEETGKSLSDYLEMVLEEQYCRHHETIYTPARPLSTDNFWEKQVCLFDNAPERAYYDVLGIRPQGKLEKMYALIGKCFGFHMLRWADVFGHWLKNRR